jgi:hypothetical protein
MQIPIAGVEDVSDRDPGSLADLTDSAKRFPESIPGNDAILDDEVGTEMSHGRKDAFPSLPDHRSFSRVSGDLPRDR